MIAWLRARSQGGAVVFRMEDLDHPRDKPGAERAAVEDLEWLGFDWDSYERQSERKALYADALSDLRAHGLAYPCTCSRRDVEAAQSAPHAGEQLHYPGTCRGRYATWAAAAAIRPPCWRFHVEPGTIVRFQDAFAGPFEQDVSLALGDFPLARDEFGAGYTLAVTVDDALMGVTEVVRGDDLLPATPAQILVHRALGHAPPAFCHVPLVVGPDGRRLCKRHGDTRVSSYRAAGVSAEAILGRLALTCGWGDGSPCSLRDLLPLFSLSAIPRAAAVWNEQNRRPLDIPTSRYV